MERSVLRADEVKTLGVEQFVNAPFEDHHLKYLAQPSVPSRAFAGRY